MLSNYSAIIFNYRQTTLNSFNVRAYFRFGFNFTYKLITCISEYYKWANPKWLFFERGRHVTSVSIIILAGFTANQPLASHLHFVFKLFIFGFPHGKSFDFIKYKGSCRHKQCHLNCNIHFFMLNFGSTCRFRVNI